MKIDIRKVHTAEQIAEVARLAEQIWREHYVSIITIEQIDYMIEKFQSVSAITGQIENQGYEYCLLQQQDGTAAGYLSIRADNGKLFLSKFYVSKEHRGQGYASQAMQFIEQLCIERGLSHIWLTVNRDNASSIAVYEKKGFISVREQVADIGNGYVMDDFIMEKKLAFA
ncbi:ribosomal protein S18 acetylase RimI-like enzyme [Paenibacillus sp. BK033]|uniref:GNAT family N-acetyltransferase n=1 Tax=Paenibacillus sp. BK033 TaxID=2512133 RepID=UPI00104F8F5E|nr:GNAT family N-acetyltransferase [Paenibacillus sp. BK033]TCM96409.1 ribosomal protein S18 acetylase RimI-like enzyme [Paenibacillus sp. BK033]